MLIICSLMNPSSCLSAICWKNRMNLCTPPYIRVSLHMLTTQTSVLPKRLPQARQVRSWCRKMNSEVSVVNITKVNFSFVLHIQPWLAGVGSDPHGHSGTQRDEALPSGTLLVTVAMGETARGSDPGSSMHWLRRGTRSCCPQPICDGSALLQKWLEVGGVDGI